MSFPPLPEINDKIPVPKQLMQTRGSHIRIFYQFADGIIIK